MSANNRNNVTNLRDDPHLDFRILSIATTCELINMSRTHVYRMERNGDFIRRVKVGPWRVGFRAKELLDWIDSRPRAPLPSSEEEDCE